MKRLPMLFITASLGFALVGCQTDDHSEHSQVDHSLMMGDIQEETSSMDVLPVFLDEYAEVIQTIYAEVPYYRELLETMPCYCGCGESVGHRSSYDCFVAEHSDDGPFTWDDHGAKCGVCLEIANTAMHLLDEGKDPEDIRNLIDEQYKDGYAPPTDTPMPEDKI
ncbi:PCYCGC domain-containing protein [Halalkalibacterium halodurans]|uniref:Lipoprotein n=1 Tax=Halalkalibacterium halodurans TaxID=86665 RepID=A0A0M0KM95_ALKHA|nr:PCYCGC domain-containing protein [Halalkalibacterium halodurans]MED4162780.1 PCYCGC domain-containing protein [Halalkalibacterium halodurans]TPE68742.1 hypothetical protein AMD02_011775 [Halalkalibacterium halodurans]